MKDTIYNQIQLDREIEALRREHDGKIQAERAAEKQRIKSLSALGREFGIMQQCNEAIRDGISGEQFRNDAVISQLESELAALSGTTPPSRATSRRHALLGAVPSRAVATDSLLDLYNEAVESGDPVAKGRALQALRNAQRTEPPAHLKKAVADARRFDLDPNGGLRGMPPE